MDIEEKDKKFTLGVKLNLNEDKPLPEFKLTDQIDENQELSFEFGKDKANVNYKLKF